jgi:stage V sporulation protein SpoVS
MYRYHLPDRGITFLYRKTGKSEIGSVGAGLTGAGFRNIQIASAVSGMDIAMRGDFDDITVEISQANVMLETGTVENFFVNNEATGTRLIAKNISIYACLCACNNKDGCLQAHTTIINGADLFLA